MNAHVKMRRKLTGSVIIAAFSALLGAAAATLFGYVVGKGTSSIGGMTKGASTGLIVITLILVCFLALTLHELGHLLAGQWVGFRLHLFVVGPLRVERGEDDRLRLCLNRDLVTSGALCLMLPTDDRNLRQRFAFTIVGGPAMSLLGGLLPLGAGIALHGISEFSRFSLLLFGFISVLLSVITTIPIPNGAYLNDGARWLRLRRDGPLADRDEALLYLHVLTTVGQPVAEWSPALIAKVLAVTDNSLFEAAGHHFAYMYALAQNRIETAGAHLDRALEIIGRFSAPMAVSYWLEGAWFSA